MDGQIERIAFQRVNECISRLGHCSGRDRLFDEFWREGELAMMVGPAGAGKSLLAVQIADSLARGSELPGFHMLFERRKVLYVDLTLSDRQLGERYSYYSPNANIPKSYKFAENLYRARPPQTEELCDWLEAAVRGGGFDAVIIDDLSAVKQTHDGIRETLAVMRRLRKLCDESGVAILAIANCDTPRAGRAVRVEDMGRSRVLCGVADSVFALGPKPGRVYEQCIVHLRSRNAAIFWKEKNAPMGSIDRLENGLLGFSFDRRFQPYIDAATLDLIARIRTMRDAKKTFKNIAAELGISKTRAFELNNKRLPVTDDHEDEEEDEFDDEPVEKKVHDPEGDARFERWMAATLGKGAAVSSIGGVNALPAAAGPTDDNHPPDASEKLRFPNEGSSAAFEAPRPRCGPERVSVHDLKRGVDGRGEEIFIQSAEEHTGRPAVWYKFDSKGIKLRSARNSLGITVTRLGPTPYL